MHPPLLGAHCSISGGLHNALLEAKRLRMNCLQVFTKNQRQWKCTPLREDQCVPWRETLATMKWAACQSPAAPSLLDRIVSHNCYLINLASPDAANLSKSLATQRVEMENCERLSIPLLVTHPGAHLGQARPRRPWDGHPPAGRLMKDERLGLQRIARALDRLHRDLPGYRVITCLETTVGSGTNLGYDFHHLRLIRELVKEPERVAFCLDTCHVTAAGYDMTTDGGPPSPSWITGTPSVASITCVLSISTTRKGPSARASTAMLTSARAGAGSPASELC